MRVRAQSSNGLVEGYLMNYTQINTMGNFDVWLNPVFISPKTIEYKVGEEWLSEEEIIERIQPRLRSPKTNDTKEWNDHQS